jgi:hypothetical protein
MYCQAISRIAQFAVIGRDIVANLAVLADVLFAHLMGRHWGSLGHSSSDMCPTCQQPPMQRAKRLACTRTFATAAVVSVAVVEANRVVPVARFGWLG